MKDRKQHVINKAHQLFIDKGFQATSIQDILDYSGISKGTFYNYFSSKNELIIAIFTNVFKTIEQGRNELLIGQDPSNIEIFIQQMELQLTTNRASKLFSLFEEVFFSNDEDLKHFIKRGHIMSLHWIFERFIDLFGVSKKPYLLDSAIMFMGILHNNIKYNDLAYESNVNISKVVRYSVERIVKLVEEVSEKGDQLIHPDFLENWFPNCNYPSKNFQQKLNHSILTLKKSILHHDEHDKIKYTEFFDFIQDELLNSKNPRKFLIESALMSLKTDMTLIEDKKLFELEEIVSDYFAKVEK